jgi:uncharacterized membrane protein YeaQ/YmgE (transglycosylase-associated protein family)
MEILYLIAVGLVIGIIARAVMPGRDPIGLVGTLLVGIVGAILGGYAWRALFGDTNGVEVIGGIIAAVVLLWAYRKVAGGGTAARRF